MPTETQRRRRFAKLRRDIKALRDRVECLEAQVRMQADQIGRIASRPVPYAPPYPYPRIGPPRSGRQLPKTVGCP